MKLAIGQRVLVTPKRREQWNAATFDALTGKFGTVSQIGPASVPVREMVQVTFDEPVELGGTRSPITGQWLDFDEVGPLEAAYDPRGTCPGCGDKALDGKATCGRVECSR